MGKFADLVASSMAPQEPTNQDLTYDNKKTLGFGSQAKASFATDENEYIRSAAKSLYPNEPLDQSVARFGKTQEGRIYHKGDDGKLYEINSPSLLNLSNVGQIVGPAIPAITGTIAGIATAPAAVTGVGAVGTMAAAGGGSAVGEIARQKIGDFILGEASTSKGPTDIDPVSVAQEGVLGAAGEGIGIGAGKLYQRYLAPDIARYSDAATNRIYDLAEKFGVRLTPAEATGLQSEISAQKLLKDSPVSANKMNDFYQQRSNEVVNAFDKFLGDVGPSKDPGRLGETVKRFSDDMIEQRKKERSSLVEPLYKDVEKNIGPINTAPILNWLEQEKKTAKGAVLNALSTAQKLLLQNDKSKIGPLMPETNFAAINQAKQVMDELINDPEYAASEGIRKYATSKLMDVRGKLQDAIKSASGNEGRYEAANAAFELATEKNIEPVIQALSPFTRINPERGTLLTSAAKAMLGDNRSPELISQAKNLFLSGSQPQKEAWNSVVRQFLEDEASNALKEAAKDKVINPAGKLFGSFSSPKTKANIKAALGSAKYREFEDLMEVFSAASRAVDSGPDTAFKLFEKERQKNLNQGAMARGIGLFRAPNWLASAQKFFADRNYEKQAGKLADIIQSGNKNAIKELRSLRKKTPQEWRNNAAIGQAFVRALQLGTNELTEQN